MVNNLIADVCNDLRGILNETQQRELEKVLRRRLPAFIQSEQESSVSDSANLLVLFIAAKRVEGCSEKSLCYYESTIRNMLETISKPEKQIFCCNLLFRFAYCFKQTGKANYNRRFATISRLISTARNSQQGYPG